MLLMVVSSTNPEKHLSLALVVQEFHTAARLRRRLTSARERTDGLLGRNEATAHAKLQRLRQLLRADISAPHAHVHREGRWSCRVLQEFQVQHVGPMQGIPRPLRRRQRRDVHAREAQQEVGDQTFAFRRAPQQVLLEQEERQVFEGTAVGSSRGWVGFRAAADHVLVEARGAAALRRNRRHEVLRRAGKGGQILLEVALQNRGQFASTVVVVPHERDPWRRHG
mmetsp:Transcript_25180/g.63374  ORF Transcript_25180/g.63374 Transcript_25180/m.63374 type:complete len:224 (-) Transcript_25180:2241-2912(-)